MKTPPNSCRYTDWEDVWIGAAITALLFEIEKILIGLFYVGKGLVDHREGNSDHREGHYKSDDL
jgi:hypothetical protein